MARFAYIRVSTDRQSYEQQIQDIKNYGIRLEDLDGVTEEKMTSNKGYEDRALNDLLKKCKAGDVIYAASTDRIGRDFFDMMKLMKKAAKDGIEIIACKQNLSIARDDVATRIIVAITAIMDEDEKRRIQHRTANKKAWQREQIEKYGAFIIENGPNAGLPCTYVGSPKFEDMSEAQQNALLAAQEASRAAKQNRAIEWRQQSKAYARAMRKKAEGWTLTQTAADLAELYAESPEDYCTPKGRCPSKGTISLWWSQANNQTLVV